MRIDIVVGFNVPETSKEVRAADFARLVSEAVTRELDSLDADASLPYAEVAFSVPRDETCGQLTLELQEWCRIHRRPWLSADELICAPGIKPEESAYLLAFIKRWDAAQGLAEHSHIAGQAVEHGGGNVYSDVVALKDGRVLVVAPEVVILYPSREAMNDESQDPWAFPRIDLVGGARVPRDNSCRWVSVVEELPDDSYQVVVLERANGRFVPSTGCFDEGQWRLEDPIEPQWWARIPQ